MEINKAHLRKAGKVAGVGLIGAGLGAAGYNASDDSPSKEKVENLEENKEELENKLSNRPTQDELDELNNQIDNLDDRPSQEQYAQLQAQLSNAFTQEEVDEIVADATEREGLLDYLPVLADEEVELESGDLSPKADRIAYDHTLRDDVQVAGSGSFDESDLDNEDFDEVRAVYRHDDGHRYEVLVREFEDGEDADEYETELRQEVDVADYGDDIQRDAEVVRNDDTVVYLYGYAKTQDYETYDFEAVRGQY